MLMLTVMNMENGEVQEIDIEVDDLITFFASVARESDVLAEQAGQFAEAFREAVDMVSDG